VTGDDPARAPGRRAPGRRAPRALRRWAWAGWTTFVVVVSVVPADWLLRAAPRQSWSALASAAHFVEYLVLAALLAWRLGDADAGASRQGSPAGVPAGKVAAQASLYALLVAVAVELVQWPLSYRSFDPLDLAADAGGIAVAAAAYLVAARRREAPSS
jgi:VanZ family protein